MTDRNTEAKLNRYTKEGNPRSVTINKKKQYLSKEKIRELQDMQKEHEGGLIRLLSLIPAILGGIGAASGVGTAIAKGIDSTNNAKHNKHMEEIEKQKLAELKKVQGSGVIVDAAKKVEQVPEEAVKWLLKTFKIEKEKQGNGIILRPNGG